ncbi:hypothetical protein, conserved [Trypanosoma brucei brucei TREU927]|uniref:Uncharacterized protein n=1 Tax=Trypanosoma brucei brucei (strain 927/4 GUTat10.1) TaxID=185431 RepID=Q57ZR5_TRYB2|nr:hypothetical protein, conserved [Trypanosoma brucei brucei TREU927]AAX79101.1 hypothetical protein, conserved [Trypanosoma brucei]AAZ11311.1 hypothetical protein, conserved [Trypanosoma brucei brucei TREU927]
MINEAAAETSSSTAVAPLNPIEYPIVFTKEDGVIPAVGIFNALQWLLPLFQLATWLPKHVGREGNIKGLASATKNTSTASEEEIELTRSLLPHFEQFFTVESKVVPNGSMLRSVQTFRYPTPRGPRTITRALVEAPNKYFSPLHAAKGGGHFLCCYEDRELLRHFTYLELDQLRFAWVAGKELVAEHKAVHQTDGTLTGLARRDIKNNNSGTAAENGEGNVTNSRAGQGCYGNGNNNNNNNDNVAAGNGATAPPPVVRRPHPSSNVITGPSQELRKAREEKQEKKYMSDLLRDECTTRWPHTPVHKSVIFSLEEQQAETVGGRPGRKGPRMYLATVELPLLNGKKGGTASFKAQQWCTTKKDAENAAAEVALRALRTLKL